MLIIDGVEVGAALRERTDRRHVAPLAAKNHAPAIAVGTNARAVEQGCKRSPPDVPRVFVFRRAALSPRSRV